MEATTASEATNMYVLGNMHIYTMVIKVADFKSEAQFESWGHLEAAMTSEATKMSGRGNMHIDTMVIKVADFKSEAKFESWGQWGHLKAAMT